MKKLETPYHMNMTTFGLPKEVYTRREVKALWEKVDEIVDWINKIEKKKTKK